MSPSIANQNVNVRLYSLSGHLVASLFQGNIGQSELTINLKSIGSGNYLMKVATDHNVMTKTINIQ